MPAELAASIIDLVLGLELGSAGAEAANRFSLEGLTLARKDDGTHEIAIRRFEADSLRLACGPLVVEVGRVALDQLLARVRVESGSARLCSLHAATAELSAVKVHGPVVFPPPSGGIAVAPAIVTAWCLGPLGAADGTIRAEIIDAHLLFDADVTVPIRGGKIDFKDATVEHVGPDSRMGVSRLGLYVDAPNGRSYLYQFSSAPVAGVEFERRGALLGSWVTDRGSVRLQPFGEGLLRQGRAGHGMGFTEQARLLFARTAVSGHVQLGDGRFAAPGMQADVAGRAEGRNLVRVDSEAVGRGLTLEMNSLSIRHPVLDVGAAQLGCDEITGAFKLRVQVEGAQLRFAFDPMDIKLSGLRLDRPSPVL